MYKIKTILYSGIAWNLGYTIYEKNQRYYDLIAVKRGFFNIFLASRVLLFSSFDYYYNLKNIEKESELYDSIKKECHTRCANRILDLSNKSKGIYLKAGQHLGNLINVMPKEFTDVLKVLQDKTTQIEFDAVEVILKENFGNNWEQCFINFDKKAIASASIAQVHKATLKENNLDVAIKLQYPNLKLQYKLDTYIIKTISKVTDFMLKYFKNKNISFFEIFNKFEENIVKELDFSNEIKNNKKLKEFLKNDNNFIIPKIYEDYSNKRCITMEFVEGIKINEIEKIKNHKKVRELLLKLYGNMIFNFGHLHCDPHSGNILVTEKDNKVKLIILDHGFYRTFDKEFIQNFNDLYSSILLFDDYKLKEISEKFNIGEFYKFLPFLFMFRNKNMQKLGDLPNRELRKELKEKKEINFEKINNTFKALPIEMILVIRSTNLISVQNNNLGGKYRDILLTYSNIVFNNIYKNKFKSNWYFYYFRIKLFLFENFRKYFLHLFRMRKEVI